MAELRLEILGGSPWEQIEYERKIFQIVAGDLADGVENGGAAEAIAFDKKIAARDGDAAAFAVENGDFDLRDVRLLAWIKPWLGDRHARKTGPWIGDVQPELFCETLPVTDGTSLRIGETACRQKHVTRCQREFWRFDEKASVRKCRNGIDGAVGHERHFKIG